VSCSRKNALPHGLRRPVLQDDFDKWRLWMADVQDPDTHTTWFSWNKVRLLHCMRLRTASSHFNYDMN